MNPYPLGLDNPYAVVARLGTTKWEIRRKEDWVCLGVYPNQFVAYDCRRAIIMQELKK
jgi:hypothetical protein